MAEVTLSTILGSISDVICEFHKELMLYLKTKLFKIEKRFLCET